MNIPKPSAMPGAKKVEKVLTDEEKAWGLAALGAGRSDLSDITLSNRPSYFDISEQELGDSRPDNLSDPVDILERNAKDARKKPVIVKDQLTDRPLKNHPGLLALQKQLVGANSEGDNR